MPDFGDPEAQVVLPRMKNDMVEVMEACVDGTLDQIDLQFEDNAAVCVVPWLQRDILFSMKKGLPIKGWRSSEGDDIMYSMQEQKRLRSDCNKWRTCIRCDSKGK